MHKAALAFLEDPDARKLVGAWPAVCALPTENTAGRFLEEEWSLASGVPAWKVFRLAPVLESNGICLPDGKVHPDAEKFIRLAALKVVGASTRSSKKSS